MSAAREEIIDFFRGVVIVDMMIVHYSDAAKDVLPGIIVKFIGYTDIAIEGFILFAGYMIGNIYLPRYHEQSKKINKKIIKRISEIFKKQYLLIFAASLPVYFIVNMNGNEFDIREILSFLFESITFSNQIGLLHILPTFIPLFLLSIPIMYLASRNQRGLIIGTSILIFMIGNFNPYIFNYGEKTIFPVILWQIYFVTGLLLGERAMLSPGYIERHGIKIFSYGLLILLLCSVLMYGSQYISLFGRIKETTFFHGSKFPLDLLGLMYRGSLLVLCYCLINMGWRKIKKVEKLYELFTLLGRNSLNVFVMHVYFGCLLGIITHLGISSMIAILVFFVNIIFSVYYFREKEKRELMYLH